VRQFDLLKAKAPKAAVQATPGPPLVFPVKRAQGDFFFELGTPGHYDFWFQNRQMKPVHLYLKYTSCRCSQVQVGFMDAETSREWEERPGVTSLAQSLVAPGSALEPSPLSRHALERNVPWKPLELKATEPLVVPEAPSPSAPTLGLLRLHWKGEKLGPHVLTAEVLAVAAGESELYRLEVPADFVPPITTAPLALAVPEITAPAPTRKLEVV